MFKPIDQWRHAVTVRASQLERLAELFYCRSVELCVHLYRPLSLSVQSKPCR